MLPKVEHAPVQVTVCRVVTVVLVAGSASRFATDWTSVVVTSEGVAVTVVVTLTLATG